MVKTKPKHPAPPKLPRLPEGTKIHKRPLLHPAIASVRAGASVPKVVYISANTPFISSVKRVRKYLSGIDARASGKIDLLGDSGTTAGKKDRQKIQNTGRGAEERKREEVLVRGTGKAIERALKVGLFFQGQEDCEVRLRTGSVGAVDDLEMCKGREDGDADASGGGEEEEVPETRVRKTSMVEVGISLR